MKKLITMLTVLTLAASLLTGCSTADEAIDDAANDITNGTTDDTPNDTTDDGTNGMPDDSTDGVLDDTTSDANGNTNSAVDPNMSVDDNTPNDGVLGDDTAGLPESAVTDQGAVPDKTNPAVNNGAVVPAT